MGHNKLDNFVSTMCKEAGLGAEGYSNHSLHSIGITLLKKDQKFGDKQVMAYSGHSSVAGLVLYERVTPEEKLQMGNHLGSMLINQQSLPALQSTATPAIQSELAAVPAIMPNQVIQAQPQALAIKAPAPTPQPGPSHNQQNAVV